MQAESKLADFPAPFEANRRVVSPEWIDHNGHMNVAFYLMAFDESIGDLFEYIGFTKAYRHANNCATFVGDFHIHYARELLLGDPMRVTIQLIDCDPKRMHFCETLYHAEQGYVAARSELMSLHIDMNTRKVAPMHETVYERVLAMKAAHASLPAPPNQSRVIGMKR